MSPEMVITIIQRAFEVLILVGGPMLLAGLIVGLLISVFQAATQINEATLSFIPKLLITFLVAVLAGPWMLSILMDYTVRLYQSIPSMIG
ncbi:flagellar biosynthesis protein FliQ [Chitinimonas sp. BJB300]|uniref:flagellar biosynthesis protein FliQ n=1 Tax=Chitinimonas sp. BJB300 TaxID=1559339 RepID=UPI000C0F3070|nr:flagellar biosynthesis protein FliQ [Chitinimonas sp. BJB300]PHV13085.1 flagellar biosynthetic protein FliQ [Chitinimonas sp. BJB300]TSJ84682.1 flagellar biosynthesis protein FliQ [Chitinimonas sp. BJB300]